MVLLKIFLYIIFGGLLMGLLFKTYATNKTFSNMCKLLGIDDMFETSGESFVGVCFFFAFLWPFAVVIFIGCFPFVYIKYMYDTKWTKEEEDNDKESLDI